MSDTLEEMRTALDRIAVRELIDKFMSAVDRRDYPTIAACFTADAKLEYDVDPFHFTGGDQFADWMQRFAELPAHTHTISNCDVVVDRDAAHADTFGFSVLVVGADGPGSVLVIGSRYVDDLIRTASGWRISQRRCTLTWQFSASAERAGLAMEP